MNDYTKLKQIFNARKKAMRFSWTAYEKELIKELKTKYGFRKNASIMWMLLYLEQIDGNNNNARIWQT